MRRRTLFLSALNPRSRPDSPPDRVHTDGMANAMTGDAVMNSEFQAEGSNEQTLFTLKVHRGEGMALLAMNWRDDEPPLDFVGFAIEYQELGGDKFFPLKNRLSFATEAGDVNPNRLSALRSPIQKFRWVHFPRNADLVGEFRYRVTPVTRERMAWAADHTSENRNLGPYFTKLEQNQCRLILCSLLPPAH